MKTKSSSPTRIKVSMPMKLSSPPLNNERYHLYQRSQPSSADEGESSPLIEPVHLHLNIFNQVLEFNDTIFYGLLKSRRQL